MEETRTEREILWWAAETTVKKMESLWMKKEAMPLDNITDKSIQNNDLLEPIVLAHSNYKLVSYGSHEGRAITIHSAPDFNEEEVQYGAFMSVNSADREIHTVRFKLLEDL